MALRIELRENKFGHYERVIEREVKQGVIDMAAGIQGAAQSVAPVQTGFLRGHIMLHDETYPTVTIEAEAEYSAYVEFGTRYQAAQPYMRPAYEQSRTSSLERLRAHLYARVEAS